MGILVQGLIFSLLLSSRLFIKILTTPKTDSDEASEDAYSWLSNVSSPVMMNISSCLWMSIALENLGNVWLSENETKYFGIVMHKTGRYVLIGGIYIRVEFPNNFFIPDKWFFYCFTYNNKKKSLEVYLNSEKIFDKIIKDHLDTFVIKEDFLKYDKFGKVGRFAGQLTDLNIWSRILNESEIRDLYLCGESENGGKIVDWKSSKIISTSSIIVSEDKTHPCDEQTDSETMIYDVKVNMEPARKVLRICDALGGTMKLPTSKAELEQINLNTWVWIPIFQNSEEEWVDQRNEIAPYLPWLKGQPNGDKYEKCAGKWLSKLQYYDTACDQENKFYCKIKDFQVFQVRGMCAENKGEGIDRKYVLRLKNTLNNRPAWRGFSSNSIQWNNNKTRWELSYVGSNKIIASFVAKEFPVGKGIWKLESSDVCRDNPDGLKLELMFAIVGNLSSGIVQNHVTHIPSSICLLFI